MIVRYARRARRDINAIFDRIALDSLDAAERMSRRIEERCQSLSHFPERGLALQVTPRTHLRRLIEGPYLIVYRIDLATVWIVAVVHGAQDLETALSHLDEGP